jgi:hypothetical protein
MQPSEFAAYHLPALERDEARYNLIVAVLGRLAGENSPELLWWSLGEPGRCAIKAPGYPIVLGDVNAAQCHALAEITRSLDYPAVSIRRVPRVADVRCSKGMEQSIGL